MENEIKFKILDCINTESISNKERLTNSKQLNIWFNHVNNTYYLEQTDKRKKFNNTIAYIDFNKNNVPLIENWIKENNFKLSFDNLYYLIYTELDILINEMEKEQFKQMNYFINFELETDLINYPKLLKLLEQKEIKKIYAIDFLYNWKTDLIKYYYCVMFYFSKVLNLNNYYELYKEQFIKKIDKETKENKTIYGSF